MADTEKMRPTLLHCLLHWEAVQTHTVYMTQPFPDGRVVDYSWVEVASQVRRMATHLLSLNLPPRSNIALLGKNSAHWVMADLAIWMAGHVTVPLYPALNGDTAGYILEHSEAKLLFLGKMDGKSDGWNEIQPVIPAGLPIISLPMSPRSDVPGWEQIIGATEPRQDIPLPRPEDLATILYTSGSTGRPKGVMHSHGSFARGADGLNRMLNVSPADRLLSYLPLAHVAERMAIEAGSLYNGCHVFFADKLDTFPADLRRARPAIFFFCHTPQHSSRTCSWSLSRVKGRKCLAANPAWHFAESGLTPTTAAFLPEKSAKRAAKLWASSVQPLVLSLG